MRKLISHGIGAAIGLIVIIIGIIVMTFAVDGGAWFGEEFTMDYSFGADFYTEMYSVTRGAVEQLNNIADGLHDAADNTVRGINGIIRGIGLLIIAVGLITTGNSAAKLVDSDEFAKLIEKTPEQKAEAEAKKAAARAAAAARAEEKKAAEAAKAEARKAAEAARAAAEAAKAAEAEKAAAASKFCPECGSAVPAGSAFCTNCGKRFE